MDQAPPRCRQRDHFVSSQLSQPAHSFGLRVGSNPAIGLLRPGLGKTIGVGVFLTFFWGLLYFWKSVHLWKRIQSVPIPLSQLSGLRVVRKDVILHLSKLPE